MKHAVSILAAALAMLVPGLALARVPTPEQLAKMSDKDLIKAIDKTEFGEDGGCRIAAFYTELSHRRPSANLQGVAAMMRGYCETFSGQPRQGLADLETAEGLTPVRMMRRIAPMIDSVAVLAAVEIPDFPAFAEHAGHVAGRDSADEFAGLVPDVFRFGIDRAQRTDADRVVLAFARASSFDALPAEIRTVVSGRAVGAALRDKDTALASRMAERLKDPESFVDLLVDRQYEPLWPALAEQAGPHLGKVLAAAAADAAATLGKAPDDPGAIKDAVRTMVLAGDYRKAVEIAGRVDHSKRGFSKMVEDDGWTINAEVKALDRLGRRDEADALFDRMAQLDPEGRGWLVNFVINRADRLVGQGRWEAALPASELAVRVAGKQGSPYAKEDAAAGYYCAAIKAGRSHDLAGWWEKIDEHWIENIGAAVQAAQCNGDTDTARRYLRDGLKNEDHRHTVILLLQPRTADLYRDEANMFEEPRRYLESDRELMALYQKYGRDLPAELQPQH